MRLSYSGRAAHRASLSQGREAFLESHVHAFERLVGVPLEQIRYDNLKPAVSRVLFGRTQVESDRWVAFRSHYQYDPVLLPAGPRGQPREGRRGGRGRLVPAQPLRADAGGRLDRGAQRAAGRRRRGRRSAAHRQVERELLRSLPAEAFDTALTLTERVDRYAQVMVRCCQYPVPARFIGHRQRVKLSASTVTVSDRTSVVAPPAGGRQGREGPRAGPLPGDPAAQARRHRARPGRATGVFTPTHEVFWAAARTALGDSAGTRVLVEVLLLHRHLQHADVLAGLAAALVIGR